MLASVLLAAVMSSAPAAPPPAAEAAPGDSLVRYVLPPIAVEAALPNTIADGLPVSISLLDQSTLSRAGVLRVADALATVPGVRVARFGAPGSMSTVSVRGVTNEQVLVLLDGRRLTPAQGGGVDLGSIDVGALERVEVVRGGASALYGPDALGGVINLITRPAGTEAHRTTFRLEGGSFGTAAAAFAHEQALGPRGRSWFTAHGLTTAGNYTVTDRGRDLTRENADARAAGTGAGFRLHRGSGLRFIVDGAVDGGEQGVPGTIEFPTPGARRDDRRSAVAADLVLGAAGNTRRITWSASAHRQRRSYSDPALAIADRHVNSALGLELRFDRALGAAALPQGGPAGSLTAGVELRRATLESTTDGDHERRTASLFGRCLIARGDLAIAPAARLDWQSDLEPVVSPRLALGLALPRALTLRAAAGLAYRPPSFDDLFAVDRGTAVGTGDLAPERARELELGIERTFGASSMGGVRLAASAFHQKVDDLIQWTPGPDGRWRPHNVSSAVLRGFELEGAAPFPVRRARPALLTASVSFLDARNRTADAQTGGRRLPYRAAIEGRAELVVPATADLSLGIVWHGVGRSFITAANTKSLPGYGLVDLSAEQRLGSSLVASLAVRNVGGVAAVDVRDYPLPGREWRLAVRVASPEVP